MKLLRQAHAKDVHACGSVIVWRSWSNVNIERWPRLPGDWQSRSRQGDEKRIASAGAGCTSIVRGSGSQLERESEAASTWLGLRAPFPCHCYFENPRRDEIADTLMALINSAASPDNWDEGSTKRECTDCRVHAHRFSAPTKDRSR